MTELPMLQDGSGLVRCRRCGAESPADADRCPSCQSWLPRNQGNRKHGGYAQLHPPDLRAHVDAFVAGVTSDLGGDLSTLQQAYVSKLGALEGTVVTLAHDISERGLLTRAGAVRATHDRLLATLATFDKYARAVGLQRPARTLRTQDYIRQAAEGEAGQ